MTGGVIVATVLQTALPGCSEGRLQHDSDCGLIIPAGRLRSPLRWRPSGTNLPLHHLQAPAPPPDAAAAAVSNQLTAEASVHFATEPAGSMIDWRID